MAQNEDVLEIIKYKYRKFTKAEKKVADLILEDPVSVMYMSITDLADTCSVGETSVFRFCRDLNLKGYQAFKISLAQSVNRNDSSTEMLNTQDDRSNSDSLMDRLEALHVEALKQTVLLNSPQTFKLAVDWMQAAGSIRFFGTGSSFVTALEAYNRFLRIEPKVAITIDTHMQAMSAALMNENDVAVIISYSGSTRDMTDIAQILKQRGVKIICITKYEKSPLSSLSDLSLLCGAQEGPLQSGGIAARISQLYLIDVLYNEYYMRDEVNFKKNNEATADAVATKLY